MQPPAKYGVLLGHEKNRPMQEKPVARWTQALHATVEMCSRAVVQGTAPTEAQRKQVALLRLNNISVIPSPALNTGKGTAALIEASAAQ